MYENIVAVNFFAYIFWDVFFADIWEHCGSGLHLRRGGLWEQQRSCQGFHTETVPQRTKVFRTWRFWWWQWEVDFAKVELPGHVEVFGKAWTTPGLKFKKTIKKYEISNCQATWKCLGMPKPPLDLQQRTSGWVGQSCTNFSSMMIFYNDIC